MPKGVSVILNLGVGASTDNVYAQNDYLVRFGDFGVRRCVTCRTAQDELNTVLKNQLFQIGLSLGGVTRTIIDYHLNIIRIGTNFPATLLIYKLGEEVITISLFYPREAIQTWTLPIFNTLFGLGVVVVVDVEVCVCVVVVVVDGVFLVQPPKIKAPINGNRQ